MFADATARFVKNAPARLFEQGRILRRLNICLLCLLALALTSTAWPSLSTPAFAQQTGAGRIVFQSDRDSSEPEIYVMNPDGTGVTRLTHNGAKDWSPAWSPDGGRIAFRSDRDGPREIYVMNADGTGATRLTNNSVAGGKLSDGGVDWSPDGGRIAFGGYTYSDGSDDIYVMNADGTGVTRLTHNGATDPVWSPDGGRIAFRSDRDGNLEIYVMNADGTGVTNLTNNAATDHGAAWSPDGGRILFASDRDGGHNEIYVMNADGTGVTRLTYNAADDHDVTWSPDGSRIVYMSDLDGSGRHGNWELYVMNADGTGVTRLTNNNAWDGRPDWSPAGGSAAPEEAVSARDAAPTQTAPSATGRIAYMFDLGGSGRRAHYEIYVMNADGTGVTRLTHDGASNPSWSPDGGRIAFSSSRDGNYEIYVMNADGTGVTRLTHDRAWDTAPAWSPDGGRIAFSSSRDGNYEIYVMNAAGAGVTRLTHHDASDQAPAWSPDGGRIAFMSRRDGNREIYVMNADGTGVTRLTHDDADDWSPSWSPDGGRIAFDSYRDGNREIYVMNAAGTGVTRLTYNEAVDGYPSWSPDGGRIAFMSFRDGRGELYVMNADGTGVTRLTHGLHEALATRPDWSPAGGSDAPEEAASARDAAPTPTPTPQPTPTPTQTPRPSPTGSVASEREIDLANTSPDGIWSDGVTIWVADFFEDKLFAYNLASGARAPHREFDLAAENTKPGGLWSDGATIWVADYEVDKLFAYNLASGARAPHREFNLSAENAKPYGIWSNGVTIWVADIEDARLYAYALATGTRVRTWGREFDLADANEISRGIWSDGVTIWVADYDDGKVYAYNLASGRRASHMEFDLADANNEPYGIWSDGATIWVADDSDDRLYAYTLATAPTPTPTPRPSPTPQPTPTPTQTPRPSPTPQPTPMSTPTQTPTPQPTIKLSGQWDMEAPPLTSSDPYTFSVTLWWDAAPNATGYTLQQSVAHGDNVVNVADLPGTTTTYTDYYVMPGNNYVYVVLVKNADGTESMSNPKSFVIPVDGASLPRKPKLLAKLGELFRPNAVHLWWWKDAVNNRTNRYGLQRRIDGGEWEEIDFGRRGTRGGTDYRHVDSFLSPGQYEYRVRGLDWQGVDGPWSNVVQFRLGTADIPPPSEAPEVSLLSTNPRQIPLAWTDVPGAAHYDLERCHDTKAQKVIVKDIVGTLLTAKIHGASAGLSFVAGEIVKHVIGGKVVEFLSHELLHIDCVSLWEPVGVILTETTFTDEDISASPSDGTTLFYYYRVRGRNAAGAGPWSRTISFTPGTPNLNLIDVTRTSVTLAWTGVEGANGYEIKHCDAWTVEALFCHSVWEYTPDSQRASYTVTINDLKPGQKYAFKIRAKWPPRATDDKGHSSWSNVLEVRPWMPFPRLSVTGEMSFTESGAPDEIRLRWDAVKYATGYQLRPRVPAGKSVFAVGPSAALNELLASTVIVTVTGLEYTDKEIPLVFGGAIPLRYDVRGMNGDIAGPWSSVLCNMETGQCESLLPQLEP